MIVGLICAFEEEGQIGVAVNSLLEAGCDRVVVADGAWQCADGSPFAGGDWTSSDATWVEAEDAGAEVTLAPRLDDGGKRDWLLRNCGAQPGDHVLFLDADETLAAADPLDELRLPSVHACVLHRDVAPNDLPGLGGEWPRGDYGPRKPLLRWLRWSKSLGCDKPGRYHVAGEPIDAYLVQALARIVDRWDVPAIAQAYRALRDHEHQLEPEEASVLPILDGVEIVHDSRPDAARVAAKRAYYEPLVAA